MTSIFLVRHAQCEGNAMNALAGRTDFKLTKDGEDMVQKLNEELKKYKIDNIYSSPSTRCIETIKPIAKYLNLNIITCKDLMERDFGIYDGMTWDNVNKINPKIMQNKIKFNQFIEIPEGESNQEVEQRMKRCMTKIAEDNKGKTVLVCSHGCAILSFFKTILNCKNYKDLSAYSQNNAAISILQYDNNKFKIIKTNKTDYLYKNKEDLNVKKENLNVRQNNKIFSS